jgi:hypothetical protein
MNSAGHLKNALVKISFLIKPASNFEFVFVFSFFSIKLELYSNLHLIACWKSKIKLKTKPLNHSYSKILINTGFYGHSLLSLNIQ